MQIFTPHTYRLNNKKQKHQVADCLPHNLADSRFTAISPPPSRTPLPVERPEKKSIGAQPHQHQQHLAAAPSSPAAYPPDTTTVGMLKIEGLVQPWLRSASVLASLRSRSGGRTEGHRKPAEEPGRCTSTSAIPGSHRRHAPRLVGQAAARSGYNGTRGLRVRAELQHRAPARHAVVPLPALCVAYICPRLGECAQAVVGLEHRREEHRGGRRRAVAEEDPLLTRRRVTTEPSGGDRSHREFGGEER